MNAIKSIARREFSDSDRSRKNEDRLSDKVANRASNAMGAGDLDSLSPELVPVVTLFSSQAHRRYHEGILMLYYDLNGDGQPAERRWHEVYGIFTGNQLAYWEASLLAKYRESPEQIMAGSTKPSYLNFTDAVYSPMKTLSAAKGNLDNVIVVSSTLKNRYILQFKKSEDLIQWYCALRLSSWEYLSLQEAYTGALLSARGSRLSDIRTILAEKRFDHEDWVSIRYGSGMAWKRCYAVVEPSVIKRKNFKPGRVLFYLSDQKKKKQLVAVVNRASTVVAVYPQSPLLIDQSTMLKLDGTINFDSPSLSTKVSKKQKDIFKETSIFLMPEQHSSVPGFDTLIRFLFPLLDSFGLYGRPKRLKAERNDPDSLLFGLPTLPCVHYLEVSDVLPLSQRSDFFNWGMAEWSLNIKEIMKGKMRTGYMGCGSSRGLAGAVNYISSPSEKSSEPPKVRHTEVSQKHINSSSTNAAPVMTKNNSGNKNPMNLAIDTTLSQKAQNETEYGDRNVAKGLNVHHSLQLADIYQKYSKIESPSDKFNTDRNRILNGSAEEIAENELPDGIRTLNLAGNQFDMYPTNDNDLFSDDNDGVESTEGTEAGSRSSRFSPDNLNVPVYQHGDSSLSSVGSPMTNYYDFNQQFRKNVTNREDSSPLEEDFKMEKERSQEFKKPTNIAKSSPSYDLADKLAKESSELLSSKESSVYPLVDYSVRESPNSRVDNREETKNRSPVNDKYDTGYQKGPNNRVEMPMPQNRPRYITSTPNYPSKHQVDHDPGRSGELRNPNSHYAASNHKSHVHQAQPYVSSTQYGPRSNVDESSSDQRLHGQYHAQETRQLQDSTTINSRAYYQQPQPAGNPVVQPKGAVGPSGMGQNYSNGPHSQPQNSRHAYGVQHQYSMQPQAPPQKQEYPNSHQYGYPRAQQQSADNAEYGYQYSAQNPGQKFGGQQVPLIHEPYSQVQNRGALNQQPYPQKQQYPRQYPQQFHNQGPHPYSQAQSGSEMRSNLASAPQHYAYQVQSEIPPMMYQKPKNSSQDKYPGSQFR